MEEKLYHRAVVVAMLIVALVGAVVSYIHIYELSVSYHQWPFVAALIPFSVDGVITVMSLTLFRYAGIKDQKAPPQVWLFLAFAILATLTANFAYGIGHGVPAAVLSCWPAAAFVMCIEVLTRTARKVTVRLKTETVKVPVQDTERPVVKRKPQRKPVLTNARAAEIAKERGKSVRTVRNHPEWWANSEVAVT